MLKILKKVKFFIWEAIHEKVNILDRLLRKLLSLIGPLCCILPRKVEEDLDHNI